MVDVGRECSNISLAIGHGGAVITAHACRMQFFIIGVIAVHDELFSIVVMKTITNKKRCFRGRIVDDINLAVILCRLDGKLSGIDFQGLIQIGFI